ncbi:hypothetical protein SFC15_16705 [Shouchella clausii]
MVRHHIYFLSAAVCLAVAVGSLFLLDNPLSFAVIFGGLCILNIVRGRYHYRSARKRKNKEWA